MKRVCFLADDELFQRIEDIRFEKRHRSLATTLKTLLAHGIEAAALSTTTAQGQAQESAE